MSEKDNRTFEERAAAWGRGEPGMFPEWDDPDDITLAQPRRPTTSGSTPGSGATPGTSSSHPGKSEKDTRTLEERIAAWNRGEFDAFPQPENPDDVTLAQPKLPTKKPG